MIFDEFHDLFRCLFWHWILMSVGIGVGSMLAPLRYQILCFGVIVFWMICWIDFDQQCTPFWHPFGIKFYVLGWFCFWWVFVSIFDRFGDRCSLTFGSLLIDVGILLAPFGSFWLPLASLWLPLASLWQALHSLGVRFASCLSFEIFGFAFSDFLCYGGGLHVAHLCTNSAKNKLRHLYTVFETRARPLVAQAT